jgi:hypothetical protein
VELDSINFCAAKILRRECRFRVKSRHSGRGTDVRYYPESDRLLRRSEMTLCANSDQSAPQQKSLFQAKSLRVATRHCRARMVGIMTVFIE